MRLSTCVIASATLAFVSSSNAAVVYTSASRNASTFVFGGSSEAFPSVALGLYNESADSILVGSGPVPPFPTSEGFAWQNSATFSTGIPYAMTTNFTDGFSSGAGSGGGEARSSLVIRFSVDQATPFQLVGSDAALFGATASASVSVSEVLTRLSDNSTVFTQAKSTLFGGSLANLSGLLAPGDYEFSVTMFAGAGGNGAAVLSGSLDRRLDLPAPGAASLVALSALVATRRRRA